MTCDADAARTGEAALREANARALPHKTVFASAPEGNESLLRAMFQQALPAALGVSVVREEREMDVFLLRQALWSSSYTAGDTASLERALRSLGLELAPARRKVSVLVIRLIQAR